MKTKKTGLARLPWYVRPLQPKKRVNKRIDVQKILNAVVEAFSAFSEEQADRNRRLYVRDVRARAIEREKRRQESARLKAVRAESKKSRPTRSGAKSKGAQKLGEVLLSDDFML